MNSNSFVEECENARNLIYENIKRELLGPGSEDIRGDIEHELITDAPITRYSTGMLFPKKSINGLEIDTKEIIGENIIRVEEDNIKVEDKVRNINNEVSDFLENVKFDSKISMSNELKPSSMGLTFFAKGNIEELYINIKASKYRKSKLQDCGVLYYGEDIFKETVLDKYIYRDGNYLRLKDGIDSQEIYKNTDNERVKNDKEYSLYISTIYCLAKQYKNGYIREPLNIENPLCIKLTEDYKSEIFDFEINTSGNLKIKMSIEICILRKYYKDNICSYTLVVINNEDAGDAKNDLKTIFQPEIIVTTKDNIGITFINGSDSSISDKDLDLSKHEESLELLYSKKNNYAVGHGVSTIQEIDDGTGLGMIGTTFMPYCNIKGIDFNIEELDVENSNRILSMKNLSDYSNLSKDETIENLKSITNMYSKWIKALERDIDDNSKIDKKFIVVAKRHIDECTICFKRINRGIEILENNENEYYAFQLMNRALLMQRAQGKSDKNDRYPGDKDRIYSKINFKNTTENEGIWRPFQLSYILMCLESISNPNCKDRDIVDLIWVPTGGGKTEAYLGLTAFTIFLRRLKDKSNSGTTVMMRYTLRLLAAQQFTRASILICACELIRRELSNELGRDKITIGLWIGSEQTPNTKEKAVEEYRKLINDTKISNLNYNKSMYNKFQVLRCPWCGTKLEKCIEWNKELERNDIEGQWGYQYSGKKHKIFCPEYECEFNEEYCLPIEVVDEFIYKEPPTLLFGTVDKFAMITWNSEAGNLFAINKKNSAPELIIQDELHLISGALGTIVGQYETVIDILCSEGGIKPKIIASTATIRNANEQCNELYARDMKQFPPSGLFEDDSFFIKEDKLSKGRQYVGIMPTGKTLTTTQVRLMSALSNKVKMLDISDKVKSEYWTLVGYFNTIKELGMTNSLINSDIQENINIVSTRLLMKNKGRFLYNVEELTSRVNANKINNTLKDLEIGYKVNKKGNEKYMYPIDVLLASNMISVGVDVSRLNLMMILQQPKLTSEYIQASSRVGRENPGIVFTLYNPSRSRDKSYYELFHDYHNSFYKYVEPTSVTPFASPARDRMLHSVFVSLIRHAGGLAGDSSAGAFINLDVKIIEKYKNKILERVKVVLDKSLTEEEIVKKEIHEISKEIDEFCSRWRMCEGNSEMPLKYYNKNNKKQDEAQRFLLKPFGKDRNIDGKPTLQSMRNVDQQGLVDLIRFKTS